MKTPLSLAAFAAVFVACLTSAARADVVKESPIGDGGTKTSVSVSTSAFTVIPAASSLTNRAGIKVRNPSTNAAPVVCTCQNTVATGITIADIEIEPGENPFIPCDNNMKLYCVSLNTSSESVQVKEYKQ